MIGESNMQRLLVVSALLIGQGPPDTCSGRYTDPDQPGGYFQTVGTATRQFAGLDLEPGVPAIVQVELCFDVRFRCMFESRCTDAGGWMIYEHLRGIVSLQVNGFDIGGPLLETQQVVRGLSQFDGTVDFAGESGVNIEAPPTPTLGLATISIPADEIDLWRQPFDVTVTMTAQGSDERCSSPSTGALDVIWRGGVVFSEIAH